jgi:hypothetical protein
MSQMIVVPSGHITSGHLNFTILDDHDVQLDGTVSVKIGWFPKTVDIDNQTYSGPAGIFLRSFWKTPGQAVSLPEGLDLKLLSVDADGKLAHVQVDVNADVQVSGVATIAVDGDPTKYIDFVAMTGTASFFGISQSFQATPDGKPV